ncbi:unnamed protein product [Rhizoctonia solani]|uniref:Uncharacterized protein n=1 Tax=Rhizoctonia solani TaxID=456999 RepID=A0A8H2XFB5_9AGAM|nr:unnamed protein product [Rhizoctonia solani]
MRTSIIAFSVAFMATTTMAKPIIRSESDLSLAVVDREPYTSVPSEVFTPVPSPAYTSIVSEPFTSIVSESATAVETNASSFISPPSYTSLASEPYTGIVSSPATPVQTDLYSPIPSPEYTPIISESYTGIVTSTAFPIETNSYSSIPSAEYTSIVSSSTEPEPTGVSSWLSSTIPTTIADGEPFSTNIINSAPTLTSSANAPWPTSNNTTHNVTSIITGSPTNYTSIISANETEVEPTPYTSFESAPTPSTI